MRSGSVLISTIAAGTVVAAVLVGAGWFGQRSLIYFPDRGPVPPAAAVLARGADVSLVTSDGLSLGAWYVPPSDRCEAERRAAVLLAPGNGGNRLHRAGLARKIAERGFGVLLLEYRGYAGNPGRPSEEGLLRDAHAARAFLRDAGIPPDRLVYLGESLGTGVVAALAVDHPPAAMVLRSPFTSLPDVAREFYHVPVGSLLRDRYPVRQNVTRTSVPLAVVHGSDDTLVPPPLSRAVANAARDAGTPVTEIEIPGAGHNDAALAEGDELLDALVTVARRAGLSPCR